MTPEERFEEFRAKWATPWQGDIQVAYRDLLTESFRDAIAEEREACAKVIPTTWLDPLLSGDRAVLPRDARWGCPEIERLLSALAAAIRART